MPATLPSALTSAIALECTTLATLWEIIRVDGTKYYFTDHDTSIDFAGNTYLTGIGYDRGAIEDKSDLSSDNLNVQGILDGTLITREDIRGGLFDGAEVWIRLVDFTNPAGGSLVRRRGWFGEVKQNNLGQFDTELRGLSDTLGENFTRVYTPACVADLGSVTADGTDVPCNKVLEPPEHQEDTYYEIGSEVTVTGVNTGTALRALVSGRTSAIFDEYLYDVAYVGDQFSDGEVTWEVIDAWVATGVVQTATNRRTFEIALSASRFDADPRYFDGGLATFQSGENTGISREIKFVDASSGGEASVSVYLRFPFNINSGDTVKLSPGCDKSIATCRDKFNNSINYKGFPHIPGDDFIRQYPESKR